MGAFDPIAGKKIRIKIIIAISTIFWMLVNGCSISNVRGINSRVLNCSFRVGKIYKPRFRHYGVDLLAEKGCDVLAMENGEVHLTGKLKGYGNTVILKHKRFFTLYGHLNKIFTYKGARVFKGEKIGEVGDTGNATTPHLHFEVIKNFKGNRKVYLDPLKFIKVN